MKVIKKKSETKSFLINLVSYRKYATKFFGNKSNNI